MTKRFSVEDRGDITDVLARYCWTVDEGDGEGYASLWTEDGVFAGIMPQPVRGRADLAKVPTTSLMGGCRHVLVNVYMEYGETTDEAIIHAYNFVSGWHPEARFQTMAICKLHLVRRPDGWKIRSNQARLLPATSDPNPMGQPEGFPYPANQATTKFPPLT
jgi:hypothetical protein